MNRIRTILLLAISFVFSLSQAQDIATFRTWAMTPPMGWNSWDCYFSSVTEDIVMKNADYMYDHNLQQYGWEYVVIDIRWYCNHPSLGGGWYNQNGTQEYVLDEYGRYLPSPRRFPSAMVNGRNEGFKALAKKIHDRGLKFGIHLMRGVPTEVAKHPTKYKLKGTDCSTDAKRSSEWAKVYNQTTSPCGWLGDNALVQNTRNGQLYYNSLMDLYAEWGVDFLKIDDLSRPFYTDEIHMIRKAIDQCGRPIVLSMSPGKTQFAYADECLKNANMWRMMDDLWDNWSALDLVFNEAAFWAGVTRPGNYADCDMLPLGQISMTVADPGYANADGGHWTNLSHDEQYTMMTLWGMCHSPLFFGGEMTRNDDFTLSLLTNEEYFRMHHYAIDARQVYSDASNGRVVWSSTDPDTGDKYLALFQRDNTGWINFDRALYKSETIAYTTDGHAVDVDIPWPEGKKTLVLVVDDGGDNFNYDHGDWINPTLTLRDGSVVPLTGTYLTRKYTKSFYNVINENTNVYGNGIMKVLGKAYAKGFSTDANAALFFTIPADMDVVRFRAKAAADDSGIGQNGSTTTLRFLVFDENPLSAEADYSAARTGLISRQGAKSREVEFSIDGAEQLVIEVSNWNDGYDYDRADIVNPVLIDADGKQTKLTSLTPSHFSSEWGSLNVNKNVEGGRLKVNGKTYTSGLGMNAKCRIVYDLPEGHQYKTFKALCGYDSSCDTDNRTQSGTTMEFIFYTQAQSYFTVDLTKIGYDPDETLSVYNIWEKRDEQPVTGIISASVPSHGAVLYRLSRNSTDSMNDLRTFNHKPFLRQAQDKCSVNQPTSTYNLLGQRLSGDIDSVKDQILIVNGRKVVRR